MQEKIDLLGNKVLHYSWEDFEETVHHLAFDMNAYSWKPQGIIPVARGGLIPSTILSHILNIPIRDTIIVRSYEGQKQQSGQILNALALGPAEIEECIFVDDIIDTGYTVETIRDHYPQALFVAPIGKPKGLAGVEELLMVKPRRIVADSVWVKFPWEGK